MIIRLVLELPDPLVAFMVNVDVGNTAVGVPEKIPVVTSNDIPAGKVPLVMAHVEAAPPVLLGVAGVIVVPTE